MNGIPMRKADTPFLNNVMFENIMGGSSLLKW